MKNYFFQINIILWLLIGESFTYSLINPAPYLLTDHKGRFTINFPSKPEYTTKTFRDQNVNYTANIYTLHNSKGTFMVSWMDYQKEYVSQYTSDELLDSERNGSISKSHGKLLQEKVLKIGKYPGREIRTIATINNIEMTWRTRVYIVGNRKYNIITITYPQNTFDSDFESFLTSFKLIP